jgi:hypothetical protein
MNKLWVRYQFLGPMKEAEKRRAERQELKTLIGTSMVRISQLESLTLARYTELRVLERLLNQTVICRDSLAQEYLLECIVQVSFGIKPRGEEYTPIKEKQKQVFPEQFHAPALEDFFDAFKRCSVQTNVMEATRALLRRLGGLISGELSLSTVSINEVAASAPAADVALSVEEDSPASPASDRQFALMQRFWRGFKELVKVKMSSV